MIPQHEQHSSRPHHTHLAAISEASDYDTVFGLLSKNSVFSVDFFALTTWSGLLTSPQFEAPFSEGSGEQRSLAVYDSF
jgi:hypothetical protein